MMDCPDNMMAAQKHICAKCFDDIADDELEFINLKKLLKEDNPEITKVNSLLYSEDEYADFLGPIELIVAEHYLRDRKLTDKDVEKVFKNIKKNYAEDIDFFEEEIDKDIMFELSCNLQENRKITHHELKLIFNYLLYCIDNRTWMPDKQAYVKWTAYFLSLFSEKEKKKYEESFIKLAKRLGIPKDKVDAMLLKSDIDPCSAEEKESSKLQSEYFSLDGNNKFDFVLNNWNKNPYLLEMYSIELEENKEFDKAEKLYKKILEIAPEFPPVEVLLGSLYKKMGNKYLADYHLNNALKSLDNVPDEAFPEEVKNQMREEIKKNLEGIGFKV